MSAILSGEGLAYERSGKRIVRDVGLSLEAGTLTVIVGPNGAGKSTLLRLLSGELAPTRGTVTVNGRAIGKVAPWRLAHARAVMPQASDLSFPFTVLEVAGLGVDGLGRGLSRRDRASLVADALRRADVAHLSQRSYRTLSGGERQRVHFARVLAQLSAGRTVEPRQALLLDEPVANLDLRHQLLVMDEARRLRRDALAVVAVLHDLQLAAEVADTLVLMEGGAIVASGAPAAVLTPDCLAEIFGVGLRSPGLPPHPWIAVDTGGFLRHALLRPPFARDQHQVADVDEDREALADDDDEVAPDEAVDEGHQAAADRQEPEPERDDARSARSLAIHCTMKREAKTNCAMMPKAAQKSNRVTTRRRSRAPRSCERLISI